MRLLSFGSIGGTLPPKSLWSGLEQRFLEFGYRLSRPTPDLPDDVRSAALKVVRLLFIPDSFTLVLPSDQFKRPCHILWRKENRSVPRSVCAPSNHHRRRATATPNRKAINSEPRGASRAILLKMLNGIPGFRPASIAPLTRLTVPFTASETSAMVDFGSGTGSKPS